MFDDDEQVNVYETSVQSFPVIAGLPDGGWINIWSSSEQDGSGIGLVMQRFNADGEKTGAETQVNFFSSSSQLEPSVTLLTGGGWVVSWTSYQNGTPDIFQRAFDANGVAIGMDTQVNTETALDQIGSSIAALDDGGWVVTWRSEDQDGSELGIYQQRYDENGAAVDGEVRVNGHTASNQSYQSVTGLADGGWIVTWASDGISGNYDIYQQRYHSNGDADGGEQLVNTVTASTQFETDVAALPEGDGGWVVAWNSFNADGSWYGVVQQRYDENGHEVGGETLVNTYTTQSQERPSIAVLEDGGWVVAWQSRDQDGSDLGIYLQRFDSDGEKVDGEVHVSKTTEGNQQFPEVAALADGGWVVTWDGPDSDLTGIYQKRYASDGAIYRVNNAPVGANKTLTAREDVAFTFKTSDFGFSDNDGDALQSVVITSLPKAGRLTLNGATVSAGQTIDEADIAAGRLKWTPPANQNGNAFASLLFKVVDDGGTANDGNDTDASANRLLFNVTEVIDQIKGNGANNRLSGTDDRDYLFGYGKADLLDGRGGADRMAGGTGNDTYVVDVAGDQIVELRNQGVDTVKTALTHRLDAHVENLVLTGGRNVKGFGNGLANDIDGNGGKNLLSGKGGKDILDGRGGADRIDGGSGEDLLKGGGGADRIDGGSGADRLKGGGGADFFVFDSPGDSRLAPGARDVILDFNRGGGDHISLRAMDANAKAGGNQAFRFIGDDAFDGKPGELRYDHVGRDTLILGDRNGDKRPDFSILVDGHIDFVRGDFLL